MSPRSLSRTSAKSDPEGDQPGVPERKGEMSHLRGHAVDPYVLERVPWTPAGYSAHMLEGLRKAAWAGMIEVRQKLARLDPKMDLYS